MDSGSSRLSVLSRCGLLAIVCTTVACSAYDSRYAYMPKPGEMSFATVGDERRVTGALVTVTGVRNPDAAIGVPAAIELRVLVANDSGRTVNVDPTKMRLFAGNFAEFPPPATQPVAEFEIATGEAFTVTAWFPFPEGRVPGGYDLDGLNLRWGIEIGGETVTQGVSFVRMRRQRERLYSASYGFAHLGYLNHRGFGGHHHRHGHLGRPGHGGHHDARPTRPPHDGVAPKPPRPVPVRPTHPPYLRSDADGGMPDL